MRCKVFTCKNSHSKTKGDPLEKISYHRFPKEKNIRNEWIKRVCRDESVNQNTFFVCSDHFKPEDFERDLRAELLRLPMKPKLKADAIPSLNLDPMLYEDDVKPEIELVECKADVEYDVCNECSKLREELDDLRKENEKLKEQLASLQSKIEEPTMKRRRGFIIWNPESPSSVSRVVQKWKTQQGTL